MKTHRRLLLSALSVLAFFGGLSATVMVFAHVRVLDAESFSATAASMMQDPVVNEYVAGAVSDVLVARAPDLAIGRPMLTQITGSVLKTPEAAEVVESAVFDAHQATFAAGGNTVVLELSDLVEPIDNSLRAFSPVLADTIPSDIDSLSVDLGSSDLAARALELAERIQQLTSVLVAFTVTALAAMIMLESTMFRGTIRIGIVLVSIGLSLVASLRLGAVVLSWFGRSDLETEALAAVWDITLGDLTNWGWMLAALGASLVAVGCIGHFSGRLTLRSTRSRNSTRTNSASLVGGLMLCVLLAACTDNPEPTLSSQPNENTRTTQVAEPTDAEPTDAEPTRTAQPAGARCGDLDVLGTDPSDRFSYCAAPEASGLTKILVDDGSGPVPAFQDEQRVFRLRPLEGVGYSVGFRFVDLTTVVWGNENSMALARIGPAGSFADLYEFSHPFHYYDLRVDDVDERDLTIFKSVFVNSSSPRPTIDTGNALLDNFPEAEAPIDGSWYRGDTLGAAPACGSSTLYRDELDGFSRVLDPAIELGTVQTIRATDPTSGESVHTASRSRLIAMAVSCPAEYEGLRIYIASESINYGDGGPRSNPQVGLWGSYVSVAAIDHHPTLAPAGQQTFAELISISYDNAEPDSSPSTAILDVIDLNGVAQQLRVYNEVGVGDVGAFLRVESTNAPASELAESPANAGAGFEPVAVPRLDSGLPATWLGITDRGELVDVDTSDQRPVRSYSDWGDPSAPQQGEGSISYLDDAWALPGTDRIYFTPCCEPAGGTGRYIDTDTDSSVLDGRVSYSGFAAVPSPDASLIAIPQMFGLYISAALPQADPQLVATSPHAEKTAVAWLRDRRGLVWAPSNDDRFPTIEIIELDDNNEPTTTRTVPVAGLTNITIAVRGDGAIVVAGCDQGSEDLSSCDHSTVLVLDPDDGEIIAELAIEPGARLGGYDYTGTYLIYADSAGFARWQGAGEAGVLGQGYRWASW